jgi:predicted nucleotidyltransferase
MCDERQLKDIAAQIVQAAKMLLGDKLERVLLYGSYARGDYDDESDIDIMILARISAADRWKTRLTFSDLVDSLGLEHDVLISVHVQDRDTFYKWLDVLPFYQNIIRDGVEFIA